ncbi:hypothetical protein ABPG72_017661 [Tetrahymena utriculariae]
MQVYLQLQKQITHINFVILRLLLFYQYQCQKAPYSTFENIDERQSHIFKKTWKENTQNNYSALKMMIFVKKLNMLYQFSLFNKKLKENVSGQINLAKILEQFSNKRIENSF